MGKRQLCALISATLIAMAGCGAPQPPMPSSSSPLASVSEPASSSAPMPEPLTVSGVTLDLAFAEELEERMYTTWSQGVDAPGGLGEFYQAHPDFVHDLNRGYPMGLLLPDGVLPEDDLLNRERFAQFVENYKNGIADRIVLCYTADPVPVWMNVITYDGNGTDYTVQTGWCGDEKLWGEAYTANQLVETETEWTLMTSMGLLSYAKYGYEPTPLAEGEGARSENGAQAALLAYLSAQGDWPEEDGLVARAPETVDGVDCYVYERNETANSPNDVGERFAVAKNLSRWYTMGEMDSGWVLQARPKSPPMPPVTVSGREIDIAFAEELEERMYTTWSQGVDAPGGMMDFCKDNPDFLFVCVQQLHTSSRVEEVMGENGMQAWLILPKGVSPADDLLNRERLAQFVENQKNGVADSIIIISTGSPLPLWLTALSCETDGTYTIATGYPREDGLEWFPTYAGHGILQTETEWILCNDEQFRIRYPKYGYEPIPLGEVTGTRTEAEVQALIPPLCEIWDAQTDSIVAREPQTVDGVLCYVFGRYRMMNGKSTYTGDSFAVAKDLSRYYFVEQAHGNWVLLARPKAAP